MLHYIIQVVAFQVLFLVVYDLFLRRQTFFIWNRIYLLVTSCLSLALPFIKIGFISDFGSEIGVITLPEVVLGSTEELSPMSQAAMNVAGISTEPATTPVWQWVLLSGSIVFLVILLIKGLQLAMIVSKSPKRWQNNILVVRLLNSHQAYSFFNSIFLGSNIAKEDQEVILEHEMVHVRHGHSLDIMWFQILKIAMWFNPAVYWYHNRIVELHEYTADHKVISSDQKQSYYENLLKQAFGVQTLSLTNAFFSKSLLKKRLHMMQQGPTGRRNYWRYALAIPLIMGMLTYVACEKEVLESNDFTQEIEVEQLSFIIDKDQFPKISDHPGYLRIEKFIAQHPEYVIKLELAQNESKLSVIHKNNLPEDSFKITTDDELSMYLVTDKQTLINKIQNYSNEAEVPYSVIDQAPTFESCDGLVGDERKKCTSMEVAKFVNQNFNTNLALDLGLTGRQRISVFFKIDKNGDVTDVGARAPHEALEEEAKRVINALPKFIPGVHHDETVVVPYSLPILFQVQ
ncbi:M56 family metallopeptidase [Winogradskyella aurantiaca]|uniref:M56 family metallopeptidase n=1 Tax=Winogradskyella aurantiaca TaxID=2219558 RepID=UPI000E1CFE1E|nr:M56 family metallopeptidase [Winogradskyella aurantiaca]